NYDGSIRAYASGIPELRRLHNSRMVYTKHPVWYIPYHSFAIYQKGNYAVGRRKYQPESRKFAAGRQDENYRGESSKIGINHTIFTTIR
ncbi:MAG: hypothetical protein LBV64_06050, partial [Mediterranea sp.]|nr:hypothetical protein [Mediterranea sp.]